MPVGGNFRATSINNNIQSDANFHKQIDPSVKILRDTIYLSWANYNLDISNRQDIFANIQKWMVPDVTGFGPQIVSTDETSIYPNPSRGLFSLKIDHEYSGLIEWEVFALTGELVRKETMIWSGHEASIDLLDIPEGIYYLKINAGSFNTTQPLIIIR